MKDRVASSLAALVLKENDRMEANIGRLDERHIKLLRGLVDGKTITLIGREMDLAASGVNSLSKTIVAAFRCEHDNVLGRMRGVRWAVLEGCVDARHLQAELPEGSELNDREKRILVSLLRCSSFESLAIRLGEPSTGNVMSKAMAIRRLKVEAGLLPKKVGLENIYQLVAVGARVGKALNGERERGRGT